MTERFLTKMLRKIGSAALSELGAFVGVLMAIFATAALAASLDWSLGDGQGVVVLLALVLAALVAFDLAIFRHVVRTYAVPRRARRRRC